MITLLYGQGTVCLPWAEERLKIRFRSDAQAIGIVRDRQIVAVVVFDNFSRTGAWCHIASDGTKRWASRSAFIAIAAFPFIQCGHSRATAVIAADNMHAIGIARRLGFKPEGRLREAGNDGGDEVVLGMLRRECRWLPGMDEKPDPA